MQKINIENQTDTFAKLIVSGEWTKARLGDATLMENSVSGIADKGVLFDFDDDVVFDSAGIVELIRISNMLLQNGCSITFVNMSHETKSLLVFYRNNFTKNIKIKKSWLLHHGALMGWLSSFLLGVVGFLSFLGETFAALFFVLLSPMKFRMKAFIKHIDHSGARALPIIMLTSFLVGLVMAYQASNQLLKFGANIFIVEMSAISIFRELAPLITAIVVAGRSASAYTAEIGTMKITEEIDAMRVMGFDPYLFLVLPRMLALMICMPLIVFAADMISIFGAMLVAKINLDIAYTEFVLRLQTDVPIKHLYIGLIKAPMYGLIISVIGCFRGFQVSGSTESIGKYTTKSVVDAIFWIIVANAVVSIMLTEMGL